MKLPKIDWRFQITIVVTLLGTLTTIAIWLIDRRPNSLTMQIASITQMAPHVEAGVSGVQVAIDGRQLDKPYLTVLEIINDGSRPISTTDFEEPIVISVKEDAKIVRGDFSKSYPKDISPTIVNQEGNVRLQPLLLNPGDRITLALVTENDEPKFAIKSRIVNISEIKIVDRSSVGKSAGVMIVRAATAVGLMAAYASLFLAYLPGGPRIRLGSISGCAIAVVCCFGAQAIFVPIAQHYNMSRFEIVAYSSIMVACYAAFRLWGYRSRRINHRIILPLDNQS